MSPFLSRRVDRRVGAAKKQSGFVTIEFVLGVAFLILPVTLLVLILPTWSERQSTARVAARESARSFVLTNDPVKAKEVAMQITDNDGIERNSVTVDLTGDPLARGTAVRATIKVKVPATVIPILGANSDAFEITATHAEVSDLYRSAP